MRSRRPCGEHPARSRPARAPPGARARLGIWPDPDPARSATSLLLSQGWSPMTRSTETARWSMRPANSGGRSKPGSAAAAASRPIARCELLPAGGELPRVRRAPESVDPRVFLISPSRARRAKGLEIWAWPVTPARSATSPVVQPRLARDDPQHEDSAAGRRPCRDPAAGTGGTRDAPPRRHRRRGDGALCAPHERRGTAAR